MDEQIEVTHPDWCDPRECTPNPDGSIRHRRTLGAVSGAEVQVDVAVVRVDEPGENGRVRAGKPRAVAVFQRGGEMTGPEMSRLTRLHNSAEQFTGRRKPGGVL